MRAGHGCALVVVWSNSVTLWLSLHLNPLACHPPSPACRVLSLLSATVTASVTLHNRLLGHILRLPKSFFDTNPAGRVLNRFSKDVETMDSVLNQSISQLCNCFATYFATLIVISIATKWFGLAVVPITIVYILLQVGQGGWCVLRDAAVTSCSWVCTPKHTSRVS